MTCQEFRLRHLDYTDRVLPAHQHALAQAHRDACGSCARFDSLVQRGLLLVRNMPPVPASPDFQARLMTRLAREAQPGGAPAPRRQWAATVIGSAASVAFAAGVLLSGARHRPPSPAPAVALDPVVAVASPAAEHPPMMRADFMAAASAGIPLWSAAALIDEAPVRFVSAQLGSPPAAR